MNQRFVYLKKDGTPSKAVALTIAMSAASIHIRQGEGPFHLRKNAEPPGPERTRAEILPRLRTGLIVEDIGTVWRVYDRDDDMIFRVRETKPALKVIDTNGNHKADFLWSSVRAEFRSISFLGAYVCKSIIGSGGTPSQHSYGNALDIGAATMDDLYRIFHWILARADLFDLEHLIVDDIIWTRGAGIHAYTGERHYHVHADFAPQFSGRCGVREAA